MWFQSWKYKKGVEKGLLLALTLDPPESHLCFFRFILIFFDLFF